MTGTSQFPVMVPVGGLLWLSDSYLCHWRCSTTTYPSAKWNLFLIPHQHLFVLFCSCFLLNSCPFFVFNSPLWKAVLFGQVVGEKMEERSNQTAWKLCQQLLRDAQMALEKVNINLNQTISCKNWPDLYYFSYFCLCLDLPASPSVRSPGQGAAGGGEGVAPRGEVDPRELPYSFEGLCPSSRIDALMQGEHRSCELTLDLSPVTLCEALQPEQSVWSEG